MNKYWKTFISVGLAVIFTCLFTLTARASLFEYEVFERYIHLGAYAEIEGSSDSYWAAASGPLDVFMYYPFEDVQAHRHADFEWAFNYAFTDTGFSIYNNITISTYYEYEPEQGYFDNIGYAYAYTTGEFYVIMVRIPPTDQLPAGSVIPFAIETETWGDLWESCDWDFRMLGVSVNQDNYEQVIFNLEVGKYYAFDFEIPNYGMETQKIVDGYLESGFGLHFSRVPIPGAIWLLGSGLVGLIGLKRKYFR